MSNKNKFINTTFLVTLALACLFDPAAGHSAASDTFRVYVLAGQSNMEGKAKNALFEHQAKADGTRELFAHLRDGDSWVERDDVFIKYLNRHGRLTLGFGSRDRTGAELEFGTVLGDHFDEPVLLIKTAWGGHSLYKKFRSPSNPPSQEMLAADLERQIQQIKRRNEKRNENTPLPTLAQVQADYGSSYRQMVNEVQTTLQNYASLFPSLVGKKPRLSGFFWFQGWNDQYNGAETEYAQNMQHLIRDVRRELDVANLPVVIAVMGQNMSKEPKGAMKTIQDAQLSLPNLAEFKGNVKSVRTDVLVDKAAEQLFPTWRENREQWERTGSDFPYHYLGSAIWYTRIGHQCAKAMLELER